MTEELFVLDTRSFAVLRDSRHLREIKDYHPELLFGIRKLLAEKFMSDHAYAAQYLRTQMANIGNGELTPDAYGQDGKFTDGSPAAVEGTEGATPPDTDEVPPHVETAPPQGGTVPPPQTSVFNPDGTLAPIEKITVNQIKAQLTALGITYKSGLSKQGLYELLALAIGGGGNADNQESDDGNPQPEGQAF